MNTYVKGKCENMCPDKEIQIRIKEKLLHFYEIPNDFNGNYRKIDTSLMVREFSRSAAGTNVPNSCDLRTERALNETVKYLLTIILNDTRKPFNFVYDFIFDRLRCIRQEIVMQNLNLLSTVQLLEPIVLFLGYSQYRLIEESIEKFDKKICQQHLQDCLTKLLWCYDEIDRLRDNRMMNEHKFAIHRRDIIESMYILLNLGDNNAISRGLSILVNSPYRKSFYLLDYMLEIAIEYCRANYYKVLNKLRHLPHILCAVAVQHVQKIRREILLRFSVAYNSKVLTVPINWLSKYLLFDDEQRCIQDIKYYNLEINPVSNTVRFDKSNFGVSALTLNARHEDFINDQLSKQKIHEILLNI